MSHHMDPIVATKCSNSLKFSASQAALAACEAIHPEVRQTFEQACQQSLQAQAQLADLMVQRGWYVPLQADAGNLSQFQANLQQISAPTGAAPTAGMGPVPGIQTRT